MMGHIIMGIDPGPEKSGVVIVSDDRCLSPSYFGHCPNDDVLHKGVKPHRVIIEEVVPYYAKKGSMCIGVPLLKTCEATGRFIERCDYMDIPCELLTTPTIRTRLCNSRKVGRPEVKQAIYDYYGGKEVAVGKKNSPGPLYCLKGQPDHVWSALAVAMAYLVGSGR